jgi:hypothetical protein
VEKYKYLQNVVARVHKITRRHLFTNKLDCPTPYGMGGRRRRQKSFCLIAEYFE